MEKENKKEEIRTNPNGANQYKPDPRQSLFLTYYLNPKSETFSNALQSALRAGYEESYANDITAQMPVWLSESQGNLKRLGMLDKAEKNLQEFLDMDPNDPKLIQIKADISKFITSRLGKKYYSERQELTGKEGEPLVISWKENKQDKDDTLPVSQENTFKPS